MKKSVLILLLASTASLVACGGGQYTTPGMTQMPGGTGYSDPYGTGAGYGTGTGTGAGYSDPYGTGAGYGTGTGTGYSDPYGTGAGMNNNPYGTGTGVGQPGAGTGYGQQPGYGAGTGYGQQPGYGAGTGYGQQPGYGAGTGTGQVVIDPMTGQPVIDPMTGQPMVSNGISQQIITKIQAAGGYRGGKADSAVVDSLKSSSVQMAFASAPLDHRTLAIKALLDGWTTAEEKSFATQIWGTIMPQDQQRLLGQDAELSKLVTSKLLQSSSNGIGSILTEISKVVGLAK